MMPGRAKLVILERLLLITGSVLLAVFGAAMIHRYVSSHSALHEFERARSTVSDPAGSLDLSGTERVDFSLWSPKRIREYQESLVVDKNLPMAVLRIDKLGLRVPVFAGTDDLTLNRGAGWIDWTARPGELGNIGISAHRDGFFRKLKDISEGDSIELITLRGKAVYVVDQIEIVKPENGEVLQPRSVPSVTLVTCYPFYFVGSAPERYIVHAGLKQQIGNEKSQDGSAFVRTTEAK
jgi:sortase A